MGWEKLLAFVSGLVDDELRLKVDYLVAENRILRGQIEGRVRMTGEQRIALAKRLGRAALEQLASIVTPETILTWHRGLVAVKFDPSASRKAKPSGRPPLDDAIVQ